MALPLAGAALMAAVRSRLGRSAADALGITLASVTLLTSSILLAHAVTPGR